MIDCSKKPSLKSAESGTTEKAHQLADQMASVAADVCSSAISTGDELRDRVYGVLEGMDQTDVKQGQAEFVEMISDLSSRTEPAVRELVTALNYIATSGFEPVWDQFVRNIAGATDATVPTCQELKESAEAVRKAMSEG